MATYFVATTGLDTNNGTAAGTPFRTVGKAISVAVAGDTINVAGGRYAEDLTVTRGGTSGSRITLQSSDNANRATLRGKLWFRSDGTNNGNNWNWTNLNIVGIPNAGGGLPPTATTTADVTPVINGSNITFSGCDYTNRDPSIASGQPGYIAPGSGSFNIMNNVGSGGFGGGTNVEFDHCTFHEIGDWATRSDTSGGSNGNDHTGFFEHAVYADTSSGLHVHDCVFWRVAGRGIQLYSGNNAAPNIHNNVFDENGCGIIIDGQANSWTITKNIFTNQAFFGAIAQGSIFNGTPIGTITNNWFNNNTGGDYHGVTAFTHTSDQTGAPGYTDQPNRNYLLTDAAPAVGYGPDTIQPASTPVGGTPLNLTYMAAEVEWAWVQPDKATLRMTGSGGAGTGLENSVLDAKQQGYKLHLKILCGDSTPDWAYTDPTNPLFPLHFTSTTTGAAITVPLAWDRAAGATAAERAAGTNLRALYTNLLTKLAAWLGATVTARDGTTFRRRDVVMGVETTMPMVEEPWIGVAYGTAAAARTTNQNQWIAASNAPAGSTLAVAQTQNANDLADAWTDAVQLHDQVIGVPLGVPAVISYATFWNDAWANAQAIAQSFAAGNANANAARRVYGWFRLLQPGNAAGSISYHDDATNTCSATNDPAGSSFECWNALAAHTADIVNTTDAQTGFTTADDSVFSAFSVDVVSGTDPPVTIPGPTYALRQVTQESVNIYHARWVNFSTTTQLIGDGARLDDEVDYVRDQLQPVLDSKAAGDAYVSTDPNSQDSIDARVFLHGVGDHRVSLSDALYTSLSDSISAGRVVVFAPDAPPVPRPDWNIELTNRAGVVLAFLEDITDRSYSEQLNQPGMFSFRIHAKNPAAPKLSGLNVGKVKIRAWRDGELVFHGRVWRAEETVDTSGDWISVTCYDGLKELELRLASGYARQTLSAISPGAALQRIIRDEINGYAGAGNTYTSRFYSGVEHGGVQQPPGTIHTGLITVDIAATDKASDVFGRIIEDYPLELAFRPDTGTIRTLSNPSGQVWNVERLGLIDFWDPFRGRTQPRVVFGIGSGPQNSESATEINDLARVVNHTIVYTDESGNQPINDVLNSNQQSIVDYGMVDAAAILENSTLNQRQSLSTRLLSRIPIAGHSVKPLAYAPRFWSDYTIGDTITRVAKYGDVTTTTSFRVTSVTVNITDDGYEVVDELSITEGDE